MAYLRSNGSARGRKRGPGGAMGDVVAGSDPLQALVTQVNRFGAAAPVGLQFAPTPFVATGSVTPELALAALLIFQRRATDAFNRFHDMGSEAAISKANLGLADPVAFVTGNLAEVTTTVSGFADSLGLPGSAGVLGGMDSSTLLLLAAGGGALWFLGRRK